VPARSLASWLRAPWWALQLATGAKSFVDNPLIGSRALNRRGLHLKRIRLAHRMADSRRARLGHQLPAEVRQSFDRDGFVEIRDFLPSDQFARLRDALVSGEFPAREHRQGDTITRRVAIGPEMLRAIPDLGDLLRDRRWRGLMRYVASNRSEPLYYLQTIFAGVEQGPPDPQVNLHSDAFQPSLKAWYFLTDVTDDEGPLTYVPGSHKLTPARERWEQQRSLTVLDEGDRLSQRGSLRIEPEELAALGLPHPRRFAVPANTLVAADTYGFHARGQSVRPAARVEIWAYNRRSPFLPWIGLDPLSLPFIAPRRAEWLARAVDWLDRRGWKQQHWQDVGPKRALER
jgi:hypothetical protein